MRLLSPPNNQAPNRTTIETTCRLEIPPRTAARHKYPPFRNTTWQINPKKETKGLKASFLTRLFCPGKIAMLKGRHCRDHPQTPTWQPHTALPQGTRGTSTLYPDSLRGGIRHSQTHGLNDPLSCPNMLPHPDLHYQKHFRRDHDRSPQTTCHSPHSTACRAK